MSFFKLLSWGLLCASLFLLPSSAWAQGKGKEKEPKEEKKPKVDPKAKDNTKKAAGMQINLDGLTREQKNVMTRCPLHGSHMRLSDNYRANASDYQESEDYPFAYQLNYRRHCTACTKAMTKEFLAAEREMRRNADKETFERCEVHNEAMFINGEYSSVDYVKKPDLSTPHAQQYHYKVYCKTCTKIQKQVSKAEAKADQ